MKNHIPDTVPEKMWNNPLEFFFRLPNDKKIEEVVRGGWRSARWGWLCLRARGTWWPAREDRGGGGRRRQQGAVARKDGATEERAVAGEDRAAEERTVVARENQGARRWP